MGFGVAGAVVLLGGLVLDAFDLRRAAARWVGYLVGWASILVGVAGLFLHLRSSFFDTQTLKSLVYTAPFAAPLSFAGLGFLILVNRMVPRGSTGWGQWVLFLAWGGFVGNFVLSLADHAQNGFFDPREWIPVFAAAFAVGFLLLALIRPGDRRLIRASLWVLGLQVVVGLLGFGFHLAADLREPGPGFFQDILYGAPPFAPLLFADLAVLAGLALWDLHAKTAPGGAEAEAADPVGGPGAKAPVFVRPETPADVFAIRRVNERAFGRAQEADLVDALRRRDAVILSLVAVAGGEVVGHIEFTPVTLEDRRGKPEGSAPDAVGLGPMAVLPEYQKRGIGSRLVREGLAVLRRGGRDAVVVLGHPGYYTRFGFAPSVRYGIRSEYDVPDEVFMVLELRPGALAHRHGVFHYDPEFGKV